LILDGRCYSGRNHEGMDMGCSRSEKNGSTTSHKRPRQLDTLPSSLRNSKANYKEAHSDFQIDAMHLTHNSPRKSPGSTLDNNLSFRDGLWDRTFLPRRGFIMFSPRRNARPTQVRISSTTFGIRLDTTPADGALFDSQCKFAQPPRGLG
jgi:hypothetical protein